MPFPLLGLLPALLTGGSAVAGALSNTKGARTSTATPTISPEYKTLADLLRSRAEERLRSNMDMSGYKASGIQGINEAFQGIQQSSANNLTSRGLASSPVAGQVGANIDMARGGNIAEFLNTIPQLQRQFQNQDLGIAQDVLRQGMGTESVGAGSAAGGAFGSAAEMLAFLSGQGLLGGGGPRRPTVRSAGGPY